MIRSILLASRSLLTLIAIVSMLTACSIRVTNTTDSISFGAAASVDKPEDVHHTKGRVIPAPSNLRTFSPKDRSIAVRAADVDLRELFEDLGYETTLWYQHVQTLANPFFEGRGPGTRGIELAAEYIEFYFKQYNLEPAFDNRDSFRQQFTFRRPHPDVEVIESSLTINGEPLVDGEDFTILGVSGNGNLTAPVTFVGYAIEEGNDGYSSFDPDTDLTGRIALLLRYEPLNEEGVSQWSEVRFSKHAHIETKLHNVADRGAVGILLVNPPDAAQGREGLEDLDYSLRFGERLEIPAFQLSEETANALLAKADSELRDLLAWRKLADRGDVTTHDFADTFQITLVSDLEVDSHISTDNVAAILPGKGDLADEWIVIGGHYDHVGYGYTGTNSDNIGKLHPGADDNASGIACALIAARRLSHIYENADNDANLRSILFIGFSAEEAGLHGSKYFVENPSIPLESVALMLNMDMVGRLRSDKLSVGGVGTAEGLEDFLNPHFESSGLTIAVTKGGRGPSDHSSFYNEGVPVIFMFTGVHTDYHTPADQAHTVNPSGGIKIVNLIESIVTDLADETERLAYVDTGEDEPRRMGKVKVRLGIQPGYTEEMETGVYVEAVFDNTSAGIGGMKAGDIILTWNGEEMTGVPKLFEFLTQHEPEDHVHVGVRRDDEEMFLDIILLPRQEE